MEQCTSGMQVRYGMRAAAARSGPRSAALLHRRALGEAQPRAGDPWDATPEDAAGE